MGFVEKIQSDPRFRTWKGKLLAERVFWGVCIRLGLIGKHHLERGGSVRKELARFEMAHDLYQRGGPLL